MSIGKDLATVCRMIKIEHSIFALPFAFMGAFLAADGWPGLYNLVVLTVAMVAVRSFAMAFNRYADLDIDRENPRTRKRELVTGELSTRFTLVFIAGMAVVFMAACALMNPLCLKLSPLALILAASYSFCKRFTHWCHFVLGSVLGLAPLAGWICVDPVITLPAMLLLCGVTLWVAGFDLLYACQDADFDRERGLFSIPARMGIPAALGISSMSHAIAAVFFLTAGWAAGLGAVYFLVATLVGVVLMAEHLLVKADDMSRVNVAFFTMNGVIAVALFVGVVVDLAVQG
ncbi:MULTISPECIES: 4-hydroxybenzoate octaprenyltransferase [unclassified Pseudodesulfovibrio]|uniref:4-hydroxybenzoate octaprenyltransferase n=1 Tax=unclassified Pseudodesulfovibrio TaxID=2661612 RepID=UPI000FEBAF85|nr:MULTISPECIES: 4-hydroxybenzoate octaprenyltransferase [unclassified Pseudodesulfovibrio]MCJ2166192.1 putative 4-hydroxybenzoate polyprenyltransferase [Pseudodesulfovibrio sp. S3-i]RWU02329.1 4-hydroxybenzoate octaprenyltransferase [Pseudodesulfovibrio sp. S3]